MEFGMDVRPKVQKQTPFIPGRLEKGHNYIVLYIPSV